MFVIRNTTVISTLLPSWHCYVFQDPFFLKARSRGKGTKEEPNIVDAMDSYRMVGCVCNEEDTNIKWFWYDFSIFSRTGRARITCLRVLDSYLACLQWGSESWINLDFGGVEYCSNDEWFWTPQERKTNKFLCGPICMTLFLTTFSILFTTQCILRQDLK